MPFIDEARARLAAGTLSEQERITIEYLLEHGAGRENPVPTETLLGELARHGFEMTVNKFQTTILADTRAGEIFIGAGSEGLYLIQNQQDAESTREFYQGLIRKQVARIGRLEELCRVQGWQI